MDSEWSIGVSYESLRYDFVQAGILPQERLARPRIKKPAMMAWARAKAEMGEYDAQVSDAGWRLMSRKYVRIKTHSH